MPLELRLAPVEGSCAECANSASRFLSKRASSLSGHGIPAITDASHGDAVRQWSSDSEAEDDCAEITDRSFEDRAALHLVINCYWVPREHRRGLGRAYGLSLDAMTGALARRRDLDELNRLLVFLLFAPSFWEYVATENVLGGKQALFSTEELGPSPRGSDPVPCRLT